MLDLYLQMYDVSYFEARGRHKPLGLYGGGEVNLKRPIYRVTSSGGHFGRSPNEDGHSHGRESTRTGLRH